MSGKLVRDNIPQIIKDDGKTPIVRILKGGEKDSALRQKLAEESGEVLAAKSVDDLERELADVQEVLRALAAEHGITLEKIE